MEWKGLMVYWFETAAGTLYRVAEDRGDQIILASKTGRHIVPRRQLYNQLIDGSLRRFVP